MKWKLQDKAWNAVAEVELPEDAPDIVIFEGRLFFYDQRVEQYVTPSIYVVPSEAALSSAELKNQPDLVEAGA